MTVVAARVSVGTTPTLIVRGDADGQNATIRNSDSVASVTLGGSNVTALNGYALLPSAGLTIELASGEALYGIVAAGTVSVHLISARSS